MKSIIIYIIIFFLIISCSRSTYDINYKGESNYSYFYLVDTIKIKDPVRIHSLKFGGQFIVSKSILKEYNNKIDFFSRPDVFLLGNDLYRDLPQKDYQKYAYPDNGGCEFVKSQLEVQGLEVYELSSSSVSFLLGLINSNYFYQKHNSYGSFAYPENKNKKSYYKIVYPLCK
ncbi:hypothetical protein [Flavobacterium sp.]|uniref:hypothetical protein n=1 Tax=Flavobacterium sp. TaxID=239 RepID=UPI0025C6F6AF|nr:hypothetical protein [Flavobacterium sp.]MBA4276935.1 hypothetical protein [Flavobacterium sp.]